MGSRAGEIETLHYGVPLPAPADASAAARADLGFPPDAAGILVVATFEPRKGHSVLMEALARMGRGRGRTWRSWAWDPSATPSRRRSRSWGWTIASGSSDGARDVDRLMQASDVLVLPSLGMECLPYAILEAMSHGKPVVGDRRGRHPRDGRATA